MMKTMTVATRLGLSFGLIALLGIGIAIYGVITLNELSRGANEMASDRMVKVEQFTELKDDLNTIARFARNIIIIDDGKTRTDEHATIDEMRQKNTKLLAALDKTLVDPKEREILKRITDNLGVYDASLDVRSNSLARPTNRRSERC